MGLRGVTNCCLGSSHGNEPITLPADSQELIGMALKQPKKPAGGAFGSFMAAKRADFQEQCPGKPVKVVMQLAGETWKKLSEEEKASYQKTYEDAKAKYANIAAVQYFIEYQDMGMDWVLMSERNIAADGVNGSILAPCREKFVEQWVDRKPHPFGDLEQPPLKSFSSDRLYCKFRLIH